MEPLEKYLRALLLLALDGQRDEGEPASPVLLLSRAGFKAPEIAELLGKKAPAVTKALERARKGKGT